MPGVAPDPVFETWPEWAWCSYLVHRVQVSAGVVVGNPPPPYIHHAHAHAHTWHAARCARRTHIDPLLDVP
jgi:hypothetical protein